MNTWNNIRAVYLLALSRLCAGVLWLMRQADRLLYIAPGDRLPGAAPSRDATQAWRSLDVTNWWCPDCGAICSSGKTHTCPTPKGAWGTKNAPQKARWGTKRILNAFCVFRWGIFLARLC